MSSPRIDRKFLEGIFTRMDDALDADGAVSTYRQYVEAVGLGYSVTVAPDLTMPAYAVPVSVTKATVAR